MDPDATNPGPLDGFVLYDQDKHVSSAVWDAQERGVLRCHEHTSKLDAWMLSAKQIELVEKAGFGYLRFIPSISLDNPLISALVERWRKETNTFHFTVGEMTITLEEVALLLGLAIDGKPVIGVTYTSCKSVCEKFLGKAPESEYTSGGMVKLSWLKENFCQCPEDAPIEVIKRHTRAYLLYLLGSTIFSTTTGNKVPVMYLPLFDNFDEAGKYAWGAAALAFLYRALGNASLRSQSTISGCLTLLQCWSYFHLNIGLPKLKQDPIHDPFPFVFKWKAKQYGSTANRDIVFYRKALDSLKPCDVEWLPYKNMENTVIPEHIEKTLILGRSKTMLICFDKAERHLPDRCLRQYGLPQPIPKDVERWERKTRGVGGGVDFSGKMESELSEWSDRQHNIVEGDYGVDESEYMQWYLKITRKFVGRPISLSYEFQTLNAGLSDIAHIADAFSTEGLDSQQTEAIARINYIARECLRDQVGSALTESVSPQTELGKRVRGKERVRRKSTSKRSRKDDSIQYYASAICYECQLCGAPVDVDKLQLCHVNSEVVHSQLHHAENNVDHLQLCYTAGEGDNSQFCPAAEEINPQLCDANIEGEDLQLCDAAKEGRDFQPCDASKEGEELLLRDSNIEAHNSQTDDATRESNGSKFCDATKEGNDLHLRNATKEDEGSHFRDVTKEDNDFHLRNGTQEGDDLELCDATKESKDSQICDGTEEGVDLHFRDTTKEGADLQLRDATKQDDDPQLQDATKEDDDSLLKDATEDDDNSQLHVASNQVDNSQLGHVADETDPQLTNAAGKVIPPSSLVNSEDSSQQNDL